MKLTKSKLKIIIKEELTKVLKETGGFPVVYTKSPIDEIPDGSLIYPDLDSMAIRYKTPEGEMSEEIYIFGSNGIGAKGLIELLDDAQDRLANAKFMFWRKEYEPVQWMETIVNNWLNKFEDTIDDDAREELLDILDDQRLMER